MFPSFCLSEAAHLVGMGRPLHPGAVEVAVLLAVEAVVDRWQL